MDQKKTTTPANGPVFKEKEKQINYSGRMGKKLFERVSRTAKENNTSISEVIKSCILYALERKI